MQLQQHWYSPKVATSSVKATEKKYFLGLWSLSLLKKGGTGAKSYLLNFNLSLLNCHCNMKQPKTICKQLDMIVFQSNFIYKNRWLTEFIPWATVFPLLV